jgi:hypothetical protein
MEQEIKRKGEGGVHHGREARGAAIPVGETHRREVCRRAPESCMSSSLVPFCWVRLFWVASCVCARELAWVRPCVCLGLWVCA